MLNLARVSAHDGRRRVRQEGGAQASSTVGHRPQEGGAWASRVERLQVGASAHDGRRRVGHRPAVRWGTGCRKGVAQASRMVRYRWATL